MSPRHIPPTPFDLLHLFLLTLISLFPSVTTLSTHPPFPYPLFPLLSMLSLFRLHFTPPSTPLYILPSLSSSPCPKCALPKLPRTYHCSTCNVCVPRLDHHCSYLATCVGQNNHKFFLLFLVYISLTCIYSISLLYRYVIHVRRPPVLQTCTMYAALTVCVIAVVPLILLTSWNCFLVATNTTAVEYAKTRAGEKVPDYRAGLWQNFEQVLGENYWFWFLPVHPTISIPKQPA